MTPFQEFRLWARRAPIGERAVTAVASAVVVALLAWLLVAASHQASKDVTSSASGAAGSASGGASNAATAVGTGLGGVGSAPGAPGASGASASAALAGSGPTANAGAGAPSAGGALPAAQGCVSPPGSAQGVTARQIKVAVAVTNIVGPAANSLFGIPSAPQQQAAFQAVIDDVNTHGGVACHQLVPAYYQVNPADAASLHQQCLDISAAGVFALFDTGSMSVVAGIPECFAQHHVAFFSAIVLDNSTIQQYYPYLLTMGTYEELYHDAASALAARRSFDPASGFKKLGFIYHSCFQNAIDAYRGWLRDAGLSDSQIVTYNVGCASAFASPSDIEQAVLTFQRDGVTHVTEAQFTGDFATFTNVAQQQGFHPKYVLPDDAIMTTSYGNQRPNADQIDGAVAVTITRNGEEHTAGIPPSPGTTRCDTVEKSLGRQTVRQVNSEAYGDACDLVWMFQAAVEHAPALQQAAVAAGLQRAGSVEFSYPQGPNDFSGPRVTYAGQYWRVAQFKKSCACWQLVDPEFHHGPA
ncbi:MAG: type 1 periplasmic-binding domain-containing protein [Acidimicrobiales bacterium]